jgi:hypothetical protein
MMSTTSRRESCFRAATAWQIVETGKSCSLSSKNTVVSAQITAPGYQAKTPATSGEKTAGTAAAEAAAQAAV